MAARKAKWLYNERGFEGGLGQHEAEGSNETENREVLLSES